MQIDAQVITIISFIALLGLVYCFFGSGFFRMIFTFTMFVAGMFFSYSLAGVYFTTFIAKAAVSLAGGFIIALLFNIFHAVGKFLFGFIACGIAIVLIFNIFHISTLLLLWDITAGLGLVLGICAITKRTVLRVITAFTGAFFVSIVGFYVFLKGISVQDFINVRALFQAVSSIASSYPYQLLSCTVLIAFAGWLVQFWHGLRSVPAQKYETKKPQVLQLPAASEKAEAAKTTAHFSDAGGSVHIS
jgi:hypothetical protein